MRSTDMTAGKPLQLILGFALPMMLGNVCQQLYTVVDGACVGRFAGIDALAAVGAADWLCWLFMGVVTGCTQGFSILISQRFGAHDEAGLKRVVGQAVLLTGMLALGLTALCQMLIVPILRLLQTPADIFPQAVLYLRILMFGLPVFSAYNIEASMLRAVGDSRSPLAAMLIASVVNIVLDFLFVVAFHWGVAGAAVATLIAQSASAAYCFFVVKALPALRFGRADLSWHPATVRQLVRLGTPTAAQNVVIGLGGLALQRVVNGYGSVFIAGYTATNKLYGLMEMAAVSFGAALAAYAGQNYGAGRADRIREGVKTGVRLSVVTAFVIAAVLFLGERSVLSLFIDADAAAREAVLAVAVRFLNIMLAPLFVLYLLYVYRSALQGMGDAMTPMISGLVELGMRVGCALTLPRLIGQDGVFFAEPAAWLGAELLLMFTCYARMSRLQFKEEQ